MKVKVHDLNISERYVPKWGKWEVVREIISNAIDADPKGYKVEEVSSDCLLICTNTVPSIEQLKVLGFGTKDENTETIGQFGEGFKLACLTACREGGEIVVMTPKAVIKSVLDGVKGNRVLKLKEQKLKTRIEGCEIRIYGKGISSLYKGRFNLSAPIGLIEEKLEADKTSVFVKGVFMHQIKMPSLFDWNLERVTFNRDRNVVELFTIANEVTAWMNRNMTIDLARRIVSCHESFFEIDMIRKWPENFSGSAIDLINTAIKEMYGDKVCFESKESEDNQIARSRGYKTISVDQGLKNVLKGKIKEVEELLSDVQHLEYVSLGEDSEGAMQELLTIMDEVNINVDIKVFSGGKDLPLGFYKDGKVYLKQDLFLPGKRSLRLGTFLHEIAHHLGGDDKSRQFEENLTSLLGILGEKIVEREKYRFVKAVKREESTVATTTNL